MTGRGRMFEPGELRLLVTTTLAISVVEGMRPTASYRAIELGGGAFEVGIIAGAYGTLALLVAIPIGRAVDRVGERPFIVAGGCLFIVAAALGFAFPFLATLIVMQMLVGCGQVCVAVGTQTLAGNTSGRSRDITFARLAVAIAAGHLIGPPIAGRIIEHTPAWLPGATGPIAFLTVAMAMGVVTTLSALTIRSSPRRTDTTSARQRIPIRDTLRTPGMPHALYVGIAGLVAIDLVIAYLPVIGEERGISPSVVGMLLALRGGMAVVSRLAIGPMLRLLGRRGLLLWTMALAGVAMAAIALPAPVWVLATFVGLSGLTIGASQPMTVSWVSSLAPEGARGVVLGVRLTGNRVGQISVPVVLGSVAAALGVGTIFVASGAALAVAWQLVRHAPIDEHT